MLWYLESLPVILKFARVDIDGVPGNGIMYVKEKNFNPSVLVKCHLR